MAYFVDQAVTYLNGASTGQALNMPPHQVGDLLVLWVTADTGTFTITSGTGWATIASNTTQASITGSWTWKLATSSSEAISITTTDGWCGGVYCIRDVNQTTPINTSTLSSAAAPTNPAKAASDSVTTTATDCLILYLLGSDLIATAAHSEPGVHHITSFDNGGTTATTSACQHAAWYFQRGTGATPAPQWTQSAMAAYAKLTIAINNVASGTIPPYIDDYITPATTITPGHHYSTLNNIAFTTTLTSTAAINGKTVTGLAGAAQADLGINPFSSGISPAATLIAKTNLNGYQITLTGGRDWSTGLIMGSHIGATPKMGTFGIGAVSDGGVVVRAGSSATAWTAWQVAARDAQPSTEVRSVWAINPRSTGTAYGTPGTAITSTAVTHIQFLMNTPLFASQAVLSELYQVYKIVVAGGTDTNPVNADGLAQIGKSFRLPVIQKAGGSGNVSYSPIQIGGGDAVNFQINAGSLQFPKRYSTATKDISFHINDNDVGISYAGKSGDVIKHTNSVITSSTPYYWEINSAATSAATWDFSGTTIVNALVTLRPVTTFKSMTFSALQEGMSTNGSSLTNCIITGSPQFDAAGATFTGCTFSYTTGGLSSSVSGAVVISSNTQAGLQAELNKIVNCTFSNNTGADSALSIIYTGSAGPITLSMSSNYFTNNNFDIGWSAPTGSDLTFNLSGTAGVSTYNANNGNTVTFINTKALTLTGIVSGSDVVFRTSGTNTVIVDIDQNSGTTYLYSYNYTPNTYVDILISKAGYVPYTVYGYLLGNSDASLPIAQVSDRNYLP